MILPSHPGGSDPRAPGLRAVVQCDGPVDVSFAQGWVGASAVAAALAEARANPGRVVQLLGARHPNEGGEVMTFLAFGVLDEEGHPWHGAVRRAACLGSAFALTGAGTSTLAQPGDSDAEAAVRIADHLMARGGQWIFRPLPGRWAASAAASAAASCAAAADAGALYAVVFGRALAAYSLCADGPAAAVEKAAAIERAREPWTPGVAHPAYVLGAEDIRRFEVLAYPPPARDVVCGDHGPVPADAARLLFAMRDAR